MNEIVYTRFIESEGYMFNVVRCGPNKFSIFNTERKRDMVTRKGIGFYISHDDFESIEEAKAYLDTL